jgi:hypothetical protein
MAPARKSQSGASPAKKAAAKTKAPPSAQRRRATKFRDVEERESLDSTAIAQILIPSHPTVRSSP